MLYRFERLIGARFRLHPLFTLVLLFSVLTGHFLEMITLFGIVLIHELGHAAMARHFGWRMREVRLTPFGGVAETDEDGSVPANEEAIVAIAGPAMNALMIGFAILMWSFGVWSYVWTTFFVQSNLILLGFNLAPILPLDGGKLFRVAIGYGIPFFRTLKFTSFWSMLSSAALVGFASTRLVESGLMMNLFFIGSFLVYANWVEWRTLPYRFLRFLLGRGERVRKWKHAGVQGHPIVVGRQASVGTIVKLLLRERMHWIVVTAPDGSVLAVVPEERCVSAYLENGQTCAVTDLFM